ncbi:hypothetical protein [Limnohabitans sp. JirII-31]|uniref:hypothetical protein n=1 Tax=Limnohabitans sp. JirII-31 TaxID=1977908 RepID=UPI00117B7184|nr:hypothetical protein [Limnohabitans sp. JirII-31]
MTPPGLSANPRNAKSPSPSLSPVAKASSQRPMRRHQARSAQPQRVLADHPAAVTKPPQPNRSQGEQSVPDAAT